ncbi:MAG: nitroreductase family protein [Roseovarius sp.]|nr:nitroreductase family protein [Roseovarius sp.]
MSPVVELKQDRPSFDAEKVLDLLASRRSCRSFDGSAIDPEVLRQIVVDGTEAPSSCNQQQWHFIVVTDRARLRRACEIAGGNPHFSDCGALIYLTFQKGWAHRNYSVVQSVAAAAYHMLLSAHLRGYSGIWNAGIGDHAALHEMLELPPIFELLGALAIGRAAEDALALKAPRRPTSTILSFETFQRPAHTIYPVKPADAYPVERIKNHDNPFAEWDPARWSWAQIADLRGVSVWAKSPVAGVFRSARHGDATLREMDLLGPVAPDARVAEIMPWGGTSTAVLRRHLPPSARLDIVELSPMNIDFIRERLRREGCDLSTTDFHLFENGRLPFGDAALDAICFPQSLEHTPDPQGMLDEARRVLKPGGTILVSSRNMTSRYGRKWREEESLGQVPLQGPFRPLAARELRRLVAERFEIAAETGIGLGAGYDAEVTTGWGRFRRRLLAIRGRRV